MNYFLNKRNTNNNRESYLKIFRPFIPALRRKTMAEKNKKLSLRNGAYIGILIALSIFLSTAGCVDSARNNASAGTPATCSADAAVCTIPMPGSVRIDASPQMYSPLMSSTIGIGLTPNVSGFNPADAEFEWNATYGQFFSWNPPDYTVSRLSQPVVNHGEKVYWSFTDAPVSPLVPVIITVTARDVQSQKVLAGSRMTLGWKDNLRVVVEKIE